jgi:hypothetical protein
MKFYKRQSITTSAPMDNRLAVQADGRIDTNTVASLQIPSGVKDERPAVGVNGMIRYNKDIGTGGEFEAYIDGEWTLFRNGRQNSITLQTFTNTNYQNTIFGPLAYDINIGNPQNVMVYIDNVYQIPTTNYELLRSTNDVPVTTSTLVTQLAGFGETVIHVENLTNFNVGAALAGTNLQNNVITEISATDLTITVSPGALGVIPVGGLAIAFFSTGTYISFSEDAVPPPSKPITALLGFDGYGPPFLT